MEGSASAPTHPHIELEPPEWQPRALRTGARGLCGAVAFFLVSFVFAYFYLRAQDPNKGWTQGPVNPSMGLGIAILVEAALVGGALGYVIGVLFVALGVGRLYLLSKRR